jgi:hypothetical protein
VGAGCRYPCSLAARHTARQPGGPVSFWCDTLLIMLAIEVLTAVVLGSFLIWSGKAAEDKLLTVVGSLMLLGVLGWLFQ